MKRIRQRLTRSHRAEFSGVNKLTEYSQTRAGSTDRRQLGIKKKIHTSLHRRSAPQVHIRRLVATGYPECLGILYVTADVSGVCSGHRRDNDGFDGIHLRTELLDIRIVGVCASGSDHNEVTAAGTLAHELERSVNVCASSH